MPLLDELKWLDAALSSSTVVQDWSNFYLTNNEIMATNGRLTACVKTESAPAITGLIPAAEVMRVVRSSPKEPKLVETDGRVKITAGRFRATVPLLQSEGAFSTVSLKPEEADWSPIPDGLVQGLKRVRPFCAENAEKLWALGCIMRDDYVMATNNTVFACTTVPGLNIDKGIVLPVWAVDFILGGREDVSEWCWTETYVAFRWPDGSWLQSQLIDAALPEKVYELLMEFKNTDVTFKTDATFKDTVKRICAISDTYVDIYADRVETTHKQASVVEDCTADVPAENDHTSWTSKNLESVLTVCDALELKAWPSPAPFQGDNMFGCILGRR